MTGVQTCALPIYKHLLHTKPVIVIEKYHNRHNQHKPLGCLDYVKPKNVMKGAFLHGAAKIWVLENQKKMGKVKLLLFSLVSTKANGLVIF